MLSNCDLVFVFVVRPDEEEYPTEQQCEQTPHIAEHCVQLIMGSRDLVDCPCLLDLNAYIMSRVQIYRIRVMAGNVVAFLGFIT